MSKFSKLPKYLPLLLFVSLNLFSQKRVYPVVGEGGSQPKQTKTKQTFSQSCLDRNAKRMGFGYKTSNLMELENVVENLKDHLPEGYHVTVPNFVGITSNQIKEFFKKNGLNIQERWNAIKPSMDVDYPLEWLRNSENRKNFIASSEQLANDIESLMISDDDLNLQNISNFLSKAQQNDWRLMVRSTGKEDTKELPNAGGNHSEPNVYPDKVTVINAIKKVVSSYFKEKSLSQRIDAGDREIFSDPLTPVLLQRMIAPRPLDPSARSGLGARDDRVIRGIPVGCVVYTGEVEGSTPGVVTIQAAFGHNEGVVNSEVAVDTFYVKNKNIRPIIQIKNQRIIPVEKDEEYGLKLINNPDALKKKQVLSDEAVIAIDQVARAVHDYYDEAMDIELVFEPSTKTIYLVQARPLQVVDAIVASYIKDIKNIDDENIAKCSTVSAAGGGVRHVTNKNQIITASTLQQALDKYLSREIDQTQVAVVIVHGQAEPTSHAAAIFRGAGKCILTCDDIEKLEKWINEEDVNLLVDTQREIVVNAINLMETDNFIKIGWFKHPISQRLSISGPAFFGPLQKVDEEFKEKPYPELIEIMKEEEKVDAEKALTALMWKLNGMLYKKKQTKLSEKKLEQLQKAYNVATRLAQEILVDKIFDKDSRSIERLYPINFLEAILFQPKEISKYIDVFSVDSVTKEYKATKKFIKDKLRQLLGKKSSVITQNLAALHFAIAGCDELYTDEIQKKWINFVYGVFESNKSNQDKFIDLLSEIEKMDVLPAWINISFSAQVLKTEDPIEILNNLAGEYEQVKDILDILKQKKEQLESYNISRWNEASKFQSNLDLFEKNFLNYYMSDEFFDLFESAKNSQLAIIVLTSLMDKFVDTFDKSIKVLKSSTKYKSDEDKVKDFKTIIGKYLDLFENWTGIIPDGSVQYHFEWSLQTYKKKIRDIFNKIVTLDLGQLNPSSHFSLSASLLGSATNFLKTSPRTLEDIFTLIHQDLLIISGFVFNKYCDYNLINTFKLFNKIKSNFPQMLYFDRDPKLGSISFFKDKIIFRYNLPLNDHSLFFDLSMNKDNTCSIKYSFLGFNTDGRWDIIVGKAYLFSYVNNVGFILNSHTGKELIFTTLYNNNSVNLDSIAKSSNLYINISVIVKGMMSLQKDRTIVPFITRELHIDPMNYQNIIEDIIWKSEENDEIFLSLLKTFINDQDLILTVKAQDAIYRVFDDSNIELQEKMLSPMDPIAKSLEIWVTGVHDTFAINLVEDILKIILKGTNERLKEAVLMCIVPKLINYNHVFKDDLRLSNCASLGIDFVKEIFNGNSERLKRVALKFMGPVHVLFSHAKDNEYYKKIATSILKKVFDKKSDELKKLAKENFGFFIKEYKIKTD